MCASMNYLRSNVSIISTRPAHVSKWANGFDSSPKRVDAALLSFFVPFVSFVVKMEIA